MFVCDKQVRYLETYVRVQIDMYVHSYAVSYFQKQMVSQLFLAYICITDICPALLTPLKLLNSHR